jgi:hypothetical protein
MVVTPEPGESGVAVRYHYWSVLSGTAAYSPVFTVAIG